MAVDTSEMLWGLFTPPVQIEHLAEFGDRSPDGLFGYAYNYLRYVFRDETGEALPMAKAYLDEIDKVYVTRPMKELDTPLMQDILCYLNLRYTRILALGAEGYIDLEERIASPVEARVKAFLACSEETM